MLPGEIDGDRVIRALGRLGWKVIHVRGSHFKMKHSDGRTLVLAHHGKISRVSVRHVLRQVGVSERDFEAALR